MQGKSDEDYNDNDHTNKDKNWNGNSNSRDLNERSAKKTLMIDIAITRSTTMMFMLVTMIMKEKKTMKIVTLISIMTKTTMARRMSLIIIKHKVGDEKITTHKEYECCSTN